jgi:basic amino acid/polyamine antiporter, APA family
VVSYVIPPFVRDIAVAARQPAVALWLDDRSVRLVLSLALLWGFVLVNLRGARAVVRTLIPLMLLMFVCGGLVIVVGFTHNAERYAALVAARGDGAMLVGEAGRFWQVVPPAAAVLFSSFIGFDAIAQAGGEARRPSRSLPLAIGLAVGGVGAFYLLFTAAVYHAVPWSYVAAASRAGDVTAPGLLTPLVHPGIAIVMVAGAAISLINDLPAMLLGVSRLCFAWAEDGVFPRGVAQVHPRTGAPGVALLLSGALASLGVVGGFLSESFLMGVDMLVTAMLVNFLVMALSVLRLPARNPSLAGDMRVVRRRDAQVVVAGAALLLLGALLVVHTWRDLRADAPAWYAHPTWVWLLVMAAGSLVYWRETRALARRGVDLRAVTSELPAE